jgi:membrane associated rhomboid family serine protease
LEVVYKNTKYTLQLGLGHGLTKGVAFLGGISILTFIITQSNRTFFYPLLGFVPSYFLGKLRLWQFVTANFLHGNLMHLSINMLGLYLFGGAVEKAFNYREFIKYFLICGGGGFILTYILWVIGFIPNTLCLGASAAVYGLLLAFSLLYPNQKILLFFVIPIQAKWLAITFGLLEFLLSFKSNGIGHLGHLGGLLAGLGYFTYKGRLKILKENANV